MGRRTKSTSGVHLLALAALALPTLACGAASPKHPTPPPAQAHKAPPPEEEEPYHVAPPPAYGNKVVLAQAEDEH